MDFNILQASELLRESLTSFFDDLSSVFESINVPLAIVIVALSVLVAIFVWILQQYYTKRMLELENAHNSFRHASGEGAGTASLSNFSHRFSYKQWACMWSLVLLITSVGSIYSESDILVRLGVVVLSPSFVVSALLLCWTLTSWSKSFPMLQAWILLLLAGGLLLAGVIYLVSGLVFYIVLGEGEWWMVTGCALLLPGMVFGCFFGSVMDEEEKMRTRRS